MEALAAFFGVPLGYFTEVPIDSAQSRADQARLAAALSRPEIEKVARRMITSPIRKWRSYSRNFFHILGMGGSAAPSANAGG